MQLHLNGFKLGNPEISELAEQNNASQLSGALPEEVDVLIVERNSRRGRAPIGSRKRYANGPSPDE